MLEFQGLIAYADALGYEVVVVPKRGLHAVADTDMAEAS